MSLTTLTSLKLSLGIDPDETATEVVDSDAYLKKLIRGCSAAIRSYLHRYCGGLITGNSVAAASVVTAVGHGLKTGDVIVIYGSNSTVTIDGERIVTQIDDDTFSVPVDTDEGVTPAAGTAGYYVRKYTEYYSGNGCRNLHLRETPVLSVSSVYLDPTGYYGQGANAFAAETLLVAGTDYAVRLEADGIGRSGVVEKIAGSWSGVYMRSPGGLTARMSKASGNIKTTYTAGYAPIPADLQEACNQYAAKVRAMGDRGGPLSSEQYDYYSYTLAQNHDKSDLFGSIRGMLAPYRPAIVLGV